MDGFGERQGGWLAQHSTDVKLVYIAIVRSWHVVQQTLQRLKVG
jgi:hypothetical protein